MQNTSVTPEFTNFVYNLLRFRCNLREKTVNKFFIENKESMILFRQAFIHSSFSSDSNYELLEFRGDVLLNAAVVEYIGEKFPDIISVKWNTRLKHKLISSKVLAQLAIENGFEKYLVVSENLQEYFESFEDKWDCSEYQSAYEDTLEAVCGVIDLILNKYAPKGVGYVACCNLIASFLNEQEISLKYEDVFDSKSRLKEIFDAQGWDRVDGCKLDNCLITYNRNEKEDQINNLLSKAPNVENYVSPTDLHVTFGYACINGNPKDKKLLVVTSANKKMNSELKAAEIMIGRLARYGKTAPIPDAYENKPKKMKIYNKNDKKTKYNY